MTDTFYPVSSPIGQEAQPSALARFNSLAVVAFSLALSSALAVPSVIIAHFALVETKRRGERGKGLAVTALVLGYLQIAFSILLAVAFASALIQGIEEFQHRMGDLQQQFDQFGQLEDQLNS
jgi:hypothetical protein